MAKRTMFLEILHRGLFNHAGHQHGFSSKYVNFHQKKSRNEISIYAFFNGS